VRLFRSAAAAVDLHPILTTIGPWASNRRKMQADRKAKAERTSSPFDRLTNTHTRQSPIRIVHRSRRRS
jgi:hypothetical protein